MRPALNDSSGFVFIVKKDTMDIIEFDNSVKYLQENINRIVNPLREASNLMKIKYDLELARELYQKIFQPVEDYLNPQNSLVIIPDGVLFYLPFLI